ncbi:MAG: FIG00761799: membrane protein, partial [uncultured Rubrobacteraceae bacterium]
AARGRAPRSDHGSRAEDVLSQGDGEEGGTPVRAARLRREPPPLPRGRLPVRQRRAGLALPDRHHGRAVRQDGPVVALGRGALRGSGGGRLPAAAGAGLPRLLSPLPAPDEVLWGALRGAGNVGGALGVGAPDLTGGAPLRPFLCLPHSRGPVGPGRRPGLGPRPGPLPDGLLPERGLHGEPLPGALGGLPVGGEGQEGPAPGRPVRGPRRGHAQRRHLPARPPSLRVVQEQRGLPLAGPLPGARPLGPRRIRGLPLAALRRPAPLLHGPAEVGPGARRPRGHRRQGLQLCGRGGQPPPRPAPVVGPDARGPRRPSGRGRQPLQPALLPLRRGGPARGPARPPAGPGHLRLPARPTRRPLRHRPAAPHGRPPLRPRRLPPLYRARPAAQEPPRLRNGPRPEHRPLAGLLRPVRELEVRGL